MWVFFLDLAYTVQPPKSRDLLKEPVIAFVSHLFLTRKQGRDGAVPFQPGFRIFMGVASRGMAPSTSGSQDVTPNP